MDYFPFFFLAVLGPRDSVLGFFLAAFFFGAAAFTAVFFAAFFAVSAFLGVPPLVAVPAVVAVSAFLAVPAFLGTSFSATGSSVCPSAPASISTVCDHSTWYVDTSEYGITCT